MKLMGLLRINRGIELCAARRIFSNSDPRSYHSTACEVLPLFSLLSVIIVVVVVVV